jgi:murein L,D-transpeptidase YafK
LVPGFFDSQVKDYGYFCGPIPYCMKRFFLFIILGFLAGFTIDGDFISSQKKYIRVREAYQEKENLLITQLKKSNLSFDNLHLLFVAYKQEKKLELYAKNKTASSYALLNTYDICAHSGDLGPKRMAGDNQVPEGFYYINRFNPNSSYYLSLGLNYPNQSDKKKSSAANLGGDIFIHGECVTIGCMPMTNDKIKEIYILAIQAYQNGQRQIPVYVFPFKMTEENFKNYTSIHVGNPALLAFWVNLKKGSDTFFSQLKQLHVTVDKEGNYLF